MKTSQIFKQSFQVSNDFNSEACITAIKNQLGDLAFKELINGEKHSLTLDFIISVNEEETHELDSEKLKALKVVKELQSLTKEQVKSPSQYDLLSLWFSASSIDTSILKKHDIEL